MTNQEAIGLITRNKSVFQFDSDMSDALAYLSEFEDPRGDV